MLLALLLVLAGTLLLFGGAEFLVKGASRLALTLGISPLVVGLTVVSFATSMPEAVASLIAQLREGSGDMAIGNVIGSNVANIGLIAGVSALVLPIEVHHQVVWKEIILMLAITLFVTALMWLGPISRFEGGFLICGLIAFVVYQAVSSKNEDEEEPSEEVPDHLTRGELGKDLLYIGIGLAGLILGGHLLVNGAVDIAQLIGLSERTIGLTVIAIGTSSPELATSVIASYRGHADIAIGNVVGSNIFNLLLIIGGVALVKPIHFSRVLVEVDALIMLAFSFLLWAVMLRQHRLSRRGGAVLFIGYIAYIGWLL